MKKILSLVLSLAMLATMCVSISITASAATVELDTDINIHSNFTSGDTVKLMKDITETSAALVIEGKTLIFDLNGYTLTISAIVLNNSADVTFKNGTVKSPDYPTAGTITANSNSTVRIDNATVLCGKSNKETAGNDTISAYSGSEIIITNSRINGADCEGTSGSYMVPGSALLLDDGTSATVTNSTLTLGNGGDYYMALSPISVYGTGTVYNGADNSVITAPTYTSEALKQPLVVGTGYPAVNDGKDTITSTADGSNSASADVKGTYAAGTAADTVYSVDVAWGSMEFTYTDASAGSWNPATHSYDGNTAAKWSCDTDANKITVTNHSNASVDAALSYTAEAAYTFAGGFYNATTGGTAIVNNKLSLATAVGTQADAAPNADAYFQIASGSLANGANSTKIGTITVTLSAPEIGGGGEGFGE